MSDLERRVTALEKSVSLGHGDAVTVEYEVVEAGEGDNFAHFGHELRDRLGEHFRVTNPYEDDGTWYYTIVLNVSTSLATIRQLLPTVYSKEFFGHGLDNPPTDSYHVRLGPVYPDRDETLEWEDVGT